MTTQRTAQQGTDWLCVILELIALASYPVALMVVWLATAVAGMGWAFFISALALVGVGSGLGWLRAERFNVGCAIAAARIVVVPVIGFVYLGQALSFALCDRPHCPQPDRLEGLGLFAALIIAYAGIPVASAIAVGIAVARQRDETHQRPAAM